MREQIDAYHLPGLTPDAEIDWDVREYDDTDIALRFPKLEPHTLAHVLLRLRQAREEHLAERPVDEIVAAIGLAAAELARRDSQDRQLLERALPAVTGYSPQMIHLVLERMLQDWHEPALRALLEAELGDPGLLDGFRRRPGVAAGASIRAYGPATAFHIFAGNVPGVAVTSLIRSLLVKTAVLGKTAAGEPLLATIFARSLARVDPGIGECIAVTYWAGGSTELEAKAFAATDLVVAYGGEETVARIRAKMPANRRLVVHGPRLSFGLVGRDALAPDLADQTAEAVARATATFDQQGCVSPHLIYVEKGGEVAPDAFAERVASQLERLETQLPRGRLSLAEATRIQEDRASAEFRAIAGAGVRLFASAGTAHTVVYDPDSVFEPSCLNRFIRIKPLDNVEDAVELLRPYAAYLQTVGVAGAGERLPQIAHELGSIGVARITTFQRMPWPPPYWHHDGQAPLRELVSWTDLED